jgi:hypothetical protein
MTIGNDNSRVINKLKISLTDDTRVVIYDRPMLIVQATVGNARLKHLSSSILLGRHFVILLAFVTLANETQIGFFILVSCCPRWPRQIKKAFLWNKIADDFALAALGNLTQIGSFLFMSCCASLPRQNR